VDCLALKVHAHRSFETTEYLNLQEAVGIRFPPFIYKNFTIVVAQVASRRPYVAEAQFQSRASSCEISGGQSGTLVLFSNTFVLKVQ
jgi:hypothetical protein